MSNNKIFENPYFNCSQLVIASMLKQTGINIDLMWKQAGFLYDNSEDKEIISPYYQDLKSDFSENNNVKIFEHYYKGDEYLVYIATILDLVVNQKISVGVALDVYELPYCRHYQKRHAYHIAEITGYKDGTLEICDHTYRFQGYYPITLIEKAIYSIYQHTNEITCKLVYVIPNQNQKYFHKNLDVTNVLKDYYQIMMGKPIFNFLQFKNAYIGLEAISFLKEDVLNWISSMSTETLDIFNVRYYQSLKEVGFSRYHMFQFLNHFNLQEANCFKESYQNWTVLGNMIARMYVTGKMSGLKDRINHRFNRLYEQEKYTLSSIEKLLVNSRNEVTF
ncbi:hypothetical protein QCQ60_004970 [Bacillus cereus]|nr:hypothetical protein [Bacillus cereus]